MFFENSKQKHIYCNIIMDFTCFAVFMMVTITGAPNDSSITQEMLPVCWRSPHMSPDVVDSET